MLAVFWFLAALMGAAAAALVVWPLWRGDAPGITRRAANVAIYRERTTELQAEVEAGRLSAAAAQSLENELGRRLLAEAGEQGPAPGRSKSGRPWLLSIALALALPALAFGLYFTTGEWRLAAPGPPELDYLAQRLSERTAAEPENADAWLLLGRAREDLGDYGGAAQAYARLNAVLEAPRADTLVLQAQARILDSQGSLDDQTVALLGKALGLDADNGRALWYLGLAAAQAGNNERARGLWRRLAAQDLPADFQRLVDTQLAALPQ